MPITDPILERSTGQPQTIFSQMEKSENLGPIITRPDGLSRCHRYQLLCGRCGVYEFLTKPEPQTIYNQCHHCGRKLASADFCHGWTKSSLPYVSQPSKWKLGQSDNSVWRKLDGSMPTYKERR